MRFLVNQYGDFSVIFIIFYDIVHSDLLLSKIKFRFYLQMHFSGREALTVIFSIFSDQHRKATQVRTVGTNAAYCVPNLDFQVASSPASIVVSKAIKQLVMFRFRLYMLLGRITSMFRCTSANPREGVEI